MGQIDPDLSIVFLGAGNMAEAIVRGMLNSTLCVPEQICVTDVNPDRVAWFREQLGVRGGVDNAAAVTDADVVILAVKPQVLSEVLSDIHGTLRDTSLVISIAAGVTMSTIRTGLFEGQRIIRVMPNTPCLVGKGVSALAAGDFVTEADLNLTESLMQATGIVLRVDESDLDAVTAVSGSGPAYYFYIVEAMLKAAEELGLAPTVASRLVYGTIEGAAAMLEEGGIPPSELRNRVTSKGGTTAAAIRSLESDGVAEAMGRAMQAAWQRSKELARD